MKSLILVALLTIPGVWWSAVPAPDHSLIAAAYLGSIALLNCLLQFCLGE